MLRNNQAENSRNFRPSLYIRSGLPLSFFAICFIIQGKRPICGCGAAEKLETETGGADADDGEGDFFTLSLRLLPSSPSPITADATTCSRRAAESHELFISRRARRSTSDFRSPKEVSCRGLIRIIGSFHLMIESHVPSKNVR